MSEDEYHRELRPPFASLPEDAWPDARLRLHGGGRRDRRLRAVDQGLRRRRGARGGRQLQHARRLSAGDLNGPALVSTAAARSIDQRRPGDRARRGGGRRRAPERLDAGRGAGRAVRAPGRGDRSR